MDRVDLVCRRLRTIGTLKEHEKLEFNCNGDVRVVTGWRHVLQRKLINAGGHSRRATARSVEDLLDLTNEISSGLMAMPKIRGDCLSLGAFARAGVECVVGSATESLHTIEITPDVRSSFPNTGGSDGSGCSRERKDESAREVHKGKGGERGLTPARLDAKPGGCDGIDCEQNGLAVRPESRTRTTETIERKVSEPGVEFGDTGVARTQAEKIGSNEKTNRCAETPIELDDAGKANKTNKNNRGARAQAIQLAWNEKLNLPTDSSESSDTFSSSSVSSMTTSSRRSALHSSNGTCSKSSEKGGDYDCDDEQQLCAEKETRNFDGKCAFDAARVNQSPAAVSEHDSESCRADDDGAEEVSQCPDALGLTGKLQECRDGKKKAGSEIDTEYHEGSDRNDRTTHCASKLRIDRSLAGGAKGKNFSDEQTFGNGGGEEDNTKRQNLARFSTVVHGRIRADLENIQGALRCACPALNRLAVTTYKDDDEMVAKMMRCVNFATLQSNRIERFLLL